LKNLLYTIFLVAIIACNKESSPIPATDNPSQGIDTTNTDTTSLDPIITIKQYEDEYWYTYKVTLGTGMYPSDNTSCELDEGASFNLVINIMKIDSVTFKSTRMYISELPYTLSGYEIDSTFLKEFMSLRNQIRLISYVENDVRKQKIIHLGFKWKMYKDSDMFSCTEEVSVQIFDFIETMELGEGLSKKFILKKANLAYRTDRDEDYQCILNMTVPGCAGKGGYLGMYDSDSFVTITHLDTFKPSGVEGKIIITSE
jgi:hypothetical protein